MPSHKPTHYAFNLLGGEHTKRPHEPDSRDSNDTLGVECARAQESNPNRDLVASAAEARRVRDDGNQSAVLIGSWDAKHQTRANLCGQPQVDQPDLAAAWRSHPYASRRSYSWNTRSAAWASSSSEGEGYGESMRRRSSCARTSCFSCSGRPSNESINCRAVLVMGRLYASGQIGA